MTDDNQRDTSRLSIDIVKDGSLLVRYLVVADPHRMLHRPEETPLDIIIESIATRYNGIAQLESIEWTEEMFSALIATDVVSAPRRAMSCVAISPWIDIADMPRLILNRDNDTVQLPDGEIVDESFFFRSSPDRSAKTGAKQVLEERFSRGSPERPETKPSVLALISFAMGAFDAISASPALCAASAKARLEDTLNQTVSAQATGPFLPPSAALQLGGGIYAEHHSSIVTPRNYRSKLDYGRSMMKTAIDIITYRNIVIRDRGYVPRSHVKGPCWRAAEAAVRDIDSQDHWSAGAAAAELLANNPRSFHDKATRSAIIARNDDPGQYGLDESWDPSTAHEHIRSNRQHILLSAVLGEHCSKRVR